MTIYAARGDRVRFEHADRRSVRTKPGTLGVVVDVDDDTVQVVWDDGTTLGVRYAAGDRVTKINR